MFLFLVVGFILLFDQFTKFLAEKTLSIGQTYPVINNVLHFSLVHNTGAAFGIFKNQAAVFIFVSVFAVARLVLVYKNLGHDNLLLKSGCMLVLSGALGNLIDRVRLGYVIDFIDFRIWPVFNVADSCIFIGACVFAFVLITKKRSE